MIVIMRPEVVTHWGRSPVEHWGRSPIGDLLSVELSKNTKCV